MTPWWSKKYGKDKVCAITHTRLRSGVNSQGLPYSIFLRCGHGFVRTALINMVKNGSSKCPLCRKNFNIEFL